MSIVYDDDNLLKSGIMHKRRNGAGKFSFYPWETRFFTLSMDGVLCYYEIGCAPSTRPPRGSMDLSKMDFELQRTPNIEGAPTNTFPIQICPVSGEKWKLSADSEIDHEKWCKVFERFLHVDKPNGREKHGYRQSVVPNMGLGGGGGGGGGNEDAKFVPTPPSQLAGKKGSSGSKKDARKASGKAKRRGGGLKVAADSSSSIFSADSLEWFCVMLIMNMCFFLALYLPSTPFPLMCFYVCVANFIVAQTLYFRSARARAAKVMAENALALSQEADISSSGKSPKRLDFQAGGGSDGGADTNVLDLLSPATSNEAQSPHNFAAINGKPIAGSSYTMVTTPQKKSPNHTWSPIDHKLFKVRIGPNYSRNKQKAESPAALYEPFAVDVFCTRQRVDHATPRFHLPEEFTNVKTNHPDVPPIFVVQIQIPTEAPPMFSSVQDGPGWSIMLYFRITEDSCRQLEDLSTASPALKLWALWCEKCDKDAAWRAKFKVIAQCSNLDELGVSTYLQSWNAKPMLIRRTSTIFRGPSYMEIDIHVHKFDNLAKSGIFQLSSKVGQMYQQVGFVIEGTDDSELPETIFGAVGMNKPQETLADFIFEEQ